MDKEKKEFIEEVTKSEYLDFILEREVKNKSRELIRRYKWIISLFTFLFVAISTILGVQSINISSKKTDVDFMTHKMTLEYEHLENFRISKEEDINKLIKDIKNSNTLKLSKYDVGYEKLNTEVEKNLGRTKNLSDSTRSFNITTKKELGEIQSELEKEFKNLISLKDSIKDNINEMKIVSSVVYAYVERGDDHEFDESKPNEFKPVFVNLPFSNKTLQITFNAYSKRNERITIDEKEAKVKIKRAEICIKYPDEKMEDEILILRERKTKEIPNTKHMIEAKFIYLPPNPILTIPDFVILEITLNPSKFEKLK